MICFKCNLPSPLPAFLLFQSEVIISNLNKSTKLQYHLVAANLLIKNSCLMRSQFHFSSLINILYFTCLHDELNSIFNKWKWLVGALHICVSQYKNQNGLSLAPCYNCISQYKNQNDLILELCYNYVSQYKNQNSLFLDRALL